MKKKIYTKSKDETLNLGNMIGKNAKANQVIALNGDLGAGKTTLVQGIGRGLDINEKINSPTFNILKCYFKGRLNLYHIDAYRLEDQINTDIGLEEVIDGDGLCVVEWAKFISDKLYNYLEINIRIIDDHTREFVFIGDETVYHNIFSNLGGFNDEL